MWIVAIRSGMENNDFSEQSCRVGPGKSLAKVLNLSIVLYLYGEKLVFASLSYSNAYFFRQTRSKKNQLRLNSANHRFSILADNVLTLHFQYYGPKIIIVKGTPFSECWILR